MRLCFYIFNALQRAIPISTEMHIPLIASNDVQCQCPSTGNPHFYAWMKPKMKTMSRSCQCPSTGNPHFYVSSVNEEGVALCDRVNALQRAIPISTRSRMKSCLKRQRCQCPSTGNPHFYAWMKPKMKTMSRSCQCPSTGNPHFYYKNKKGLWAMALPVSMPFNGQSPFLPI